MKNRYLPKIFLKRVLACVLTASLVLPTTGVSTLASSISENTKEKQYNPYIVEALEKVCPEGQNVTELLDNLKEQGIIDENGMPVEAVFDVNGEKMSLDELTLEAKKQKTGAVRLDGRDISWEDVNRLIKIKEAVTFLEDQAEITESNQNEYMDSLKSLQDQLEHGEVKMYGSTDSSTFGAGISHQARLTVTPDRTVLTETGNPQVITVKASLITKQNVPVTFHYQAISGTAMAEGSGNVTIPAGELTTKFDVTYYGSNEKRDGKSLFYVTCDDVHNALFENGASGGKNISFPITVEKNYPFVWEHDVAGELSHNNYTTEREESEWEWDGPFWGHTEHWTIRNYHKEITCNMNYQHIKQYVDNWGDNIFTYTYNGAPSFSVGGVSIDAKGSYTSEMGRISRENITSLNISDKTHAQKENQNYSYVGGISSNMHIKEVHDKISLEKLIIPNGTFYVGQSVPVSAVFDEYIRIDQSIQLKLLDGTVLYPQEIGTVGNSCTFLYPIPEIPSGEFPKISELSINGTVSFSGDALTIRGQNGTSFELEKLAYDAPDKIMMKNKRCLLRYYKDASFLNVWNSIDDNLPGKQWVTEVITIREGKDNTYRKWIQSSCERSSKIDLKAQKYLQMPKEVQEALKDTPYAAYADSTKYLVDFYVKSMYLSVDGGKNRVPFYVIAQYGDTTETNEVPVALVARYKAKLNTTKEPVTEAAEVFMDPNVGSTYDYILGEKEAELIFSQTSKDVVIPQYYSVKNAVFAYPGAATIDYSNENPFLSDWTSLVDNPEDLKTYHIEYDGNLDHLKTSDKENPTYLESTDEGQKHSSINKIVKDKEEKILTLKEKTDKEEDNTISTKLYEMENPVVTKGFRVETDELSFTAKFNDEDFSFVGTKNLIWVSSDESVASIKYPDEFKGKKAETYGADHTARAEIIPTGKVGNVYFTLYALNGETEGYTPTEVCRTITLFCEPGKEPYLKVPSAKGQTPVITANQLENLDVCYISNLTALNAQEASKSNNLGQYQLPEYPTEFKMDVYEADFKGEPQGEPVYSTSVVSTENNTVGSLRIPGEILKKNSTNTEIKYVAKISADSLKSKVTATGPVLEREEKTATVGINVLPAPPSLSLDKLESYSVLDETEQTIGYELEMHDATPISSSLSVTDSDGNVILSQALVQGKNEVKWTPERLKDKLKKAYVVKVSLQLRSDESAIVDSYVVYVYNHEAIDILVNAQDGKKVSGKTDVDEITWDNHEKVKSLISADGKTITLDGKKVSLRGLSNDINLASMISINYGDYVWGQISDQIKWDVKDDTKANKKIESEEETATTLNFEQGGLYSDINSYDYVSYSPSEKFMAVGLEDGKTVITATHASTGMKSSITVTSKTLKDQLYLFKFLPEQKTKLEYKNGKGKQCVIETDENGELALYEESGIVSDIHLFSESGKDSYIGTIIRKNIMSGEQDISKLEYYPINNYKLRCVSRVNFYVTDENGAPYSNKKLWIRGGVYKNGDYCYGALLGKNKNHLEDGKEDQVFTTDENGSVDIYFDSSQFYTRKEETLQDRNLNANDSIVYHIETKFQLDEQIEKTGTVYEPQMIHVSSSLNEYDFINDCSVNVQARVAKTGPATPVINTQYYGQCNKEGEMCEGGSVYGYNGSIGISMQYPTAVLYTESLFWGEDVETEDYIYTDSDGVDIPYGKATKKIDDIYKAHHVTTEGVQFDDQKIKVVTYEFADMPVVETEWTLKNSEVKQLVPEDKTVPIDLAFSEDKEVVKEVPVSFSCTNKTTSDPIKNNKKSRDDLQELLDFVSKQISWAPSFITDKITKQDFLNFAAIPLNGLVSSSGLPLSVDLTPTKDPRCFHATITMGVGLMGDSTTDTEYWEKGGQGGDTYHYHSDYNKFTNTSNSEETHSNPEFAECYGLTDNGGRFSAVHRDYKSIKNIFKKGWAWSKDQLDTATRAREREYLKAKAARRMKSSSKNFNVGISACLFYEFRYGDDGKWSFINYGGAIQGNMSASIGANYNIMLGYVPCNFSITLDLGARLRMDFTTTGTFTGIEEKNNNLTTIGLNVGLDVFGGVGIDWHWLAIKIGIYGKIKAGYTFKDLHGYDVDFEKKQLNPKNESGHEVKLTGEVGIRWALKLWLFSFGGDIPIAEFNIFRAATSDYDDIGSWWGNTQTNGVHSMPLDEGVELCSLEQGLESRDYLQMQGRDWIGGSIEEPTNDGSYNMKLIQSNAYSYSGPVYNDDGSIIAFLSDSDSSELEDTLASYAVLENGKFVNQHGIAPVTYVTDELNNVTNQRGSDGILDPVYDENGCVINPYRTTDRTGYGDNNIKIAGTKDFSVATWERLKSSIESTVTENGSNSDISATLNQSEIYASVWNGEKWVECRLTENCTCDMAPMVSVNDNYAIVAWRNCMGSDVNDPLNFNVRDIVNARIYDKQKDIWSDTVTLYNGQTGKVHSLETAIMSDGTAMASYVIKTSDDSQVNNDTEIMYTVINSKGEVQESTRVTNDNNSDINVQLSCVNWNSEEHFILGWYNEAESNQLDEEGNPVVKKDIRLMAVNSLGLPSSDFVESIRAAGAEIICADFKFSKPVKHASLDDLSILWMNTVKDEVEETQEEMQDVNSNTRYAISAIRFLQDNGKIVLSTPIEIAKMNTGNTIESFSTCGDKETLRTVLQSTNYDIDLDDPTTYTVKEVQSEETGETKQMYIPVGKTNLYTVSSKYRLCSVETEEPIIDRSNIMTGFSSPMGFTVTNTGLYDIDKLVVRIDGKDTEYDVELTPSQKQTITAYYKIPTEKIHDVDYSITAYSKHGVSKPEECSGTIKLNLPEVAISNMKIVAEEKKERTIQVNLDNGGIVPFEDSGKQIVLGLYDVDPEQNEDAKPLKEVTINKNNDLALVDGHSYSYQFNIPEKTMDKLLKSHYTDEQLKEANNEIPKSNITMYAKTCVLDEKGNDEEEEYTFDNQDSVQIQSLVEKYQSDVTIGSRIETGDNSADAVVTVQNNSYGKKAYGNVIASLVNSKGKVISKLKQTYDAEKDDRGIICLDEEETKEIRLHFTEKDMLEGYSVDEAVAISTNYGETDPNDNSAKLSSFNVVGQQIAKDMFEAENKDGKAKVIKREVKVEVDGKTEKSTVEVHQNHYKLQTVLNDKQLQTFVSIIPRNQKDNIQVLLNGKEISKGDGAQLVDAKLSTSTNTVTVIVDAATYEQMEVTRKKVEKNKSGKEKTVEYKERYDLNVDRKPVDEFGSLVDLEADDIVNYQLVTVQNEGVYTATLQAELQVDMEKTSKELDLSKLTILLKATMKKNSKGEENSCKLTWNAISEADGYLVYGAKCDTANKTYSMKRLALIEGSGTTSFTHTGLKAKQGYKYLIKAYRLVDGKRETLSISYVARTYAGGKTSVYANPVKVTMKKQSITLKLGKTYTIEATVEIPKGKKNKKQGPQKRYISSDKSIATVTSKGKIRAKKKGTCYVYVIAQNGVNKKIKIVVK